MSIQTTNLKAGIRELTNLSSSRLIYILTVHGSLIKDENHVRQTEGEFSFHCEGRNVHVHHVTINNYVIHGSESSPRQSPDAKNESKNKV